MPDPYTPDDPSAEIDGIFDFATAAEPEETTAPSADASAALDQVREILLGRQKREIEHRLVQAEQRMELAAAAMKTDIGRQIDDLRSAIQGKLDTLSQTLGAETEERSKQCDKLQAELQSRIAALETRVTTLQDQLEAAQKELRENLQREVDGVTEALETKTQRIASVMESETSRLRTDCVDRTTMSSLLSELARGISAEQVKTIDNPGEKSRSATGRSPD